MHAHVDKSQEDKNQSVVNANPQKQNGDKSTFQFAENKPEAIEQRELQEMMNNSPQVKKASQLQAKANNYSAQQKYPVQKKENKTGLPDKLKSGVENLSGYSMDDVKVHYNSDKPAQLHAHAYAQGNDIHLASGQERHLPHEAWHVVQQKQGKVKPTLQTKEKVKINNDIRLENEADIMGHKALQSHECSLLKNGITTETVQRMNVIPEKDYKKKLGNQKATIDKLNKLISIMKKALAPIFIKDTMTIEIINKGEITPAWNHHKGTTSHPGKLGNIGVEFNKWYLEKVSLGELIGMFIHEVGVHTLADKLMGIQTQKDGKHNTKTGSPLHEEFKDQSEDHKNAIEGKIEKYPNAIEDPKSKKKGRSRQRDHVNLAKSLSGGKSTRANSYKELYLHTGEAIDSELNGKAKDKALKELTQSFLFDLGRLAATDDGGAASIFWNSGNIGELMKYYQQYILKPEEGNYKWLKKASLGIKTGKWQIRGYLLSQLGALAISSNPSVQVARSATAGLVTGGIILATGATLGAVAAPALIKGVAVGAGVYLIQKLFGI